MTTHTSLTGTRVLVVGGARNLGAAISRAAADAGAHVVVGARDLDRAQALAAQLPDAEAVRLDITDEASIAAAVDAAGPLDHVVVLPTAHHNVPVTAVQRDGVLAALEAKVVGPLLLAKHLAPMMGEGGSLTLFSGVAAWRPAAPHTVMGVTNGAVQFLAAHLAVELAPLRVNAISPGLIDSGAWDGLGDTAKHALLAGAAAGNPVGRAGRPQDVTDAVLWLMGAGFVTGETLHVEGGARLV